MHLQLRMPRSCVADANGPPPGCPGKPPLFGYQRIRRAEAFRGPWRIAMCGDSEDKRRFETSAKSPCRRCATLGGDSDKPRRACGAGNRRPRNAPGVPVLCLRVVVCEAVISRSASAASLSGEAVNKPGGAALAGAAANLESLDDMCCRGWHSQAPALPCRVD